MTPPDSEPLFLGIDVGGTNIKLGIVSDSGAMKGATSIPTQAHLSPSVAVGNVYAAVQELLSCQQLTLSQLRAVGLGTPGPMDIPRGLILEPVNLPGWRNFPIREAFSQAFGLPVVFTNDANAAAFGEYWLGSAHECRSLVFFTLGTGVGGGIIIEDQGLEGAHSLGAELGHVRVDWSPQARRCSCGRLGHLEAYASATGLVARAKQATQAAPESMLSPQAHLTAKDIADAAEAGDAVALQLVLETADYLARGVEQVAHTIDPEAILLGGAMTFGGAASKIGQMFLQRIQTQAQAAVFPEIYRGLKIAFAQLGSDAGYIGAAGLARVRWRAGLTTTSADSLAQ